MKKESTALYIIRLALTLLVITSAVAALLACVNAVTVDKIAQIKAEKITKAISAVLPDGASAKQVDYTDPDGVVRAVYESETGYAVEVAPNGFGGAVDMMVGVDKEGKVLAISIITHSETPGLGAVSAAPGAKGEAFRGQFAGMTGVLAVTKDGGTVDALSGATITSRAVTAGVNAAIACAAKLG